MFGGSDACVVPVSLPGKASEDPHIAAPPGAEQATARAPASGIRPAGRQHYENRDGIADAVRRRQADLRELNLGAIGSLRVDRLRQGLIDAFDLGGGRRKLRRVGTGGR